MGKVRRGNLRPGDGVVRRGGEPAACPGQQAAHPALCACQAEKESDGYAPLWFEKRLDPLTGEMACMYKGGYWEAKEKKDWHMCPNIF